MSAVSDGHVLGQRRVFVAQMAAGVSRYPSATVKDLDAETGEACVNWLAHEAVRGAVVVVIDLNMVVNVDDASHEGRDLVALGG
ncbi:hypothetical protein PAMC26577_19615 [Caballeronia sordidicola]|uniref:Uncharacterized protein n=1 Tax=Caballeronia sordidicola TaxID=196367 RepID=A0A242MP95_CABSO|nr:hypothetical protein PAMC26577_19615 [Caballeronia sordidicola]